VTTEIVTALSDHSAQVRYELSECYTPVYILSVLTMAAFIVMMIALSATKDPPKGEFVPPAFESMAVQGVPEVPEGLEYSSPYRDGMAYRFSICANVTMDSNKATVYSTNAEGNNVYLKLRVLDENDNILGETGLLKPGEYVKDVELIQALSAGTGIRLKIMSYAPDTYLSEGSVVLNTTIGTAP
jgi:hypothetical protein